MAPNTNKPITSTHNIKSKVKPHLGDFTLEHVQTLEDIQNSAMSISDEVGADSLLLDNFLTQAISLYSTDLGFLLPTPNFDLKESSYWIVDNPSLYFTDTNGNSSSTSPDKWTQNQRVEYNKAVRINNIMVLPLAHKIAILFYINDEDLQDAQELRNNYFNLVANTKVYTSYINVAMKIEKIELGGEAYAEGDFYVADTSNSFGSTHSNDTTFDSFVHNKKKIK